MPLAAQHQLVIAGGDVNAWNHPLALSVTLIGEAPTCGVLTRRGAQAGDALAVTGEFGGSILGKHFDFQPRVAEALTLRRRYDLHAGLDVSDGLALDLSRLCEESGCGAVLRAADIPLAPAAHELSGRAGDGRSALDHALGDGEDFELLLALPAEQAQRMLRECPIAAPLRVIGEIQSEPGLWLEQPDGTRRPLDPTGWQY